jgi:dihydrofolate reductase
MGHITGEWIRRAGGFVLGRKTYEIFAAHWPHVTNDPIAETLNTAPKYVASRTLDRVTWRHATLIRGNVAEAVGRLKGEPGGELQVHGSGDLIQTLLTHRVIDEFRLWVVPVVLGTGKRLFREGAPPAAFELVETQTSTTGVLLQVYRAAGTLTYGSFMLEPLNGGGDGQAGGPEPGPEIRRPSRRLRAAQQRRRDTAVRPRDALTFYAGYSQGTHPPAVTRRCSTSSRTTCRPSFGSPRASGSTMWSPPSSAAAA